MTRAADLAAAEAEHAALYASQRARVAEGWVPTPADLAPLYVLRNRIRSLRPHTLRWAVTLTSGHRVAVETRDKSDWVDDNTAAVVGASAEIVWRGMVSTHPAGTKCHETSAVHYEPGWRDREDDHRAAVERLCDANGWEGASIERDGEKWEP